MNIINYWAVFRRNSVQVSSINNFLYQQIKTKFKI